MIEEACTIDLQSYRRSILRRQGLIEGFDEPLQAVQAMVGVQTQYAASLSVAVACRLKKSHAGWDDVALQAGGALVKSWSLRHTLHAHTTEDHALVVGTIGPHLYGKYACFMEDRGSTLAIGDQEAKILAALADGPLSRKELHERVPELKALPGVGWGMDVAGLAFQRRLCIVGRGAEQKFCALPHQDAARRYGELLRRYLAAYGPATAADFTFWTGLKMTEFKIASREIADQLVSVHVAGLKAPRLALRDDMPKTDDSEQPGVRLLAKFDPLILAHKDKSLFMSPELKPRVFRIAGQVEAVVLIGAQAAGTWRLERKSSRTIFTIEPFRAYGKREIARIEREAERIAKGLGLKNAEVQFA